MEHVNRAKYRSDTVDLSHKRTNLPPLCQFAYLRLGAVVAGVARTSRELTVAGVAATTGTSMMTEGGRG